MQLSSFDFDLPPERIALAPANPRDSAKLLYADGEGISDKNVIDLPDCLKAGDLLVANNSYVVPARLRGKTETGKPCDVLLATPLDEYHFQVMMKGAPKKIIFSKDIYAEASGKQQLRFNVPFSELYDFIEKEGEMPLPPYIEKRRQPSPQDREDYQTIYHKKEREKETSWSSIAAPTAGLHFTKNLFEALKARGVGWLELTLHVGIGTFLPIKTENVKAHQMMAERAFLSEAAAQKINETKQVGGRLIAVGTTSLRTLESAATREGKVRPFQGSTDLFIYPGYRFQVIDGLLTNFHLPRSTPLLLVAALMGIERTQKIYAHALGADYRFFSYGDACLFFPPAID